MSARQAKSQMDPGRTDLQTFVTPLCARNDGGISLIEVRASFVHDPTFVDFLLIPAFVPAPPGGGPKFRAGHTGSVSYFPRWHGNGCNSPASPPVEVNCFQRYRAKRADKIESPAIEPPPLPKEEKTRPADTFQPIHVDDAQYLQLTRALRPGVGPVLKDLRVDVPGSNAAAVMGGAGQSLPAIPPSAPPEQPPGAPIV